MEFIDHTGHIFSLASFDAYPTGYEYETFGYIFYLDDEYTRRLSVNNYYIKPIRVLLHKSDGDLTELSIDVDSSVFKLIGSKTIQEKIEHGGFNIEFEENDEVFKSELTLDDINIIDDDADILITFYVIGNASEPATWTSNVLIDATQVKQEADKETYCPITVGGVFYDEQEELVINARNMGVYFPKDILSAVYGTSVYNDVINETVYNAKVKEYLMNYMRLHGETGNIEHMTSALKFFGWGDKVTLCQLVKTDNDIISQYIRNFLSTDNDLLTRFDNFEHTGLVSLYVNINGETGEEEHPVYDNDFWGEMKPVLEDYTNKVVNIQYDEQNITYQRKYFDYLLPELMLKISALRQYYQKYFLPLHAMCMSAAAQVQVHANDIKYVTRPSISTVEKPVVFECDRTKQTVEFPTNDVIYLYTQERYVDDNLNEFTNYIPVDRYHDIDIDTKVYYINDVCANIPITFHTDNMDFFRCHLILERDGGTVVYESSFAFSNTDAEYKDFVIFPRLMKNGSTMSLWQDNKFHLHLLCNDVWYEYDFELKVPELHLQFGKLQYRYDEKLFRQVNSISDTEVDFQTFMYLPSLVDVNNINFPQNVIDYTDTNLLYKFIDMYRESPSIASPVESGYVAKKYYNRVHYYKLLDDNGNEIAYDINDSVNTISLYRKLFNDDGTQKYSITHGPMSYDIYLMHDDDTIDTPAWYVILISKETIDAAMLDADIDAPEITFPSGYNMTAGYVRSDNKWLINRMTYIDSEGVNHFNTTDIIVGTINNVELPFILIDGTKWVVSPFSIGMQHDTTVTSTTNTFLMSIGDGKTGYDKGYYDVTVVYSLDGIVKNQQQMHARILVE